MNGHEMENVTLAEAKEHLEELVERAAHGEPVRITDPRLGTVRLTAKWSPDLTAPRGTGTMPPFVPLKEPRKLGHLDGIVPLPPDDFFAPLTEEELKDWYGDEER